jgi:hypothetical protein
MKSSNSGMVYRYIPTNFEHWAMLIWAQTNACTLDGLGLLCTDDVFAWRWGTMRQSVPCLFTAFYIRDRTSDPVMGENVLMLQVTCKMKCDDLFEFCAWGTSRSLNRNKVSHYTPRRLLGAEELSSYSFTMSALDGGEWSASRPGRALVPGKEPPIPFVLEAGWAPEPVWTQARGKILCLCRGSNFNRPVVQPVVRHYTDWATRL